MWFLDLQWSEFMSFTLDSRSSFYHRQRLSLVIISVKRVWSKGRIPDAERSKWMDEWSIHVRLENGEGTAVAKVILRSNWTRSGTIHHSTDWRWVVHHLILLLRERRAEDWCNRRNYEWKTRRWSRAQNFKRTCCSINIVARTLRSNAKEFSTGNLSWFKIFTRLA